jgi:hypothetical protein
MAAEAYAAPGARATAKLALRARPARKPEGARSQRSQPATAWAIVRSGERKSDGYG